MFQTIPRVTFLFFVLAVWVGSEAEAATAKMKAANGTAIGQVTLTQAPGGVLLLVELRELSPGWHGFHVHERGACTPDFTAAGGHFNPTGSDHGLGNDTGSHAGDMPNIYATMDGNAVAEVFNPKITLSGGNSGVFDEDGSAIVIHARADTHGMDPGAGGRVACGVIENE